MVPLASLGDARAPRYSGFRQPTSAFVYGGLTLCAVPSQVLPLASVVLDGGPTTPTQLPGSVWARPRSLAATWGVSFDFLSSRYLDVSVPWVGSACAVTVIRPPGFPIRTSPDRRVLARSPKLFAGSCVLRRLLLPRHPPRALEYLSPRQSCACGAFATAWTQRLPVHPISQCQIALSATARERAGP